MTYCISMTIFIKIVILFLININNNNILSNIDHIEVYESYIGLIEQILVLGISNQIKINTYNNYDNKITISTIILITTTIIMNKNLNQIINIKNILFIKDNIYFVTILAIFFSYSTIFILNTSHIKSPIVHTYLYITVCLLPFIGICTYLSILYMTDLGTYLQSLL